MSRNIKFRAWDDINKRWLMGYEEIGGFSLVGEAVACGEWDSVLSKLVKDEFGEKGEGLIVQQFTGLKDMNGKEIYEGDILKLHSDRLVVIFDDLEDAAFEAVFGEDYLEGIRQGELMVCGGNSFAIKTKIIGNILQNPELLEQNEELEGNNDENGICDVCKRPYNMPGGGPCMGCGRGTSIATGLLLLDNPLHDTETKPNNT